MMHTLRTAALPILAALACATLPAAAAEVDGLSVTIPMVPAGPALDGTLTSPAWQQAVKVHLGFDRLTKGASAEDTTAYLLTDGKSLFVGFDAQETRTPVLANQHTNMAGVDTDDEVKVALWPGGSHGFDYQFIATPIGTRYQYSSENTAYEPSWDAAGKVNGHGYVVTMRIPLSVMRGANQKTWLLNLTRFEPTTGSLYAWSGGPTFNGTTDVNYARPMLGMPLLASVRPKPRVGIYGLGAIAAPRAGGTTSRSGLDLSVPLTGTTSFIASIHPDTSNVESDQQSISPTAFRRYLNETRPFFTQGANFYNWMECDACPNEQSLYTPAIPTPRDGFAVEGTQGPLTFAGFDAIGVGRNDFAQSVIYRNAPRTFIVSAQHVGVKLQNPFVKDDTLQLATKWTDQRHKFIYANYGTESGTFVTDPGKAKFAEFGGGFYGPNSFTGGGIRRIGAQYSPYDGFFSNNDIAGYGFFTDHTWTTHGGKFKTIDGNFFMERYHGAPGVNQATVSLNLDLVTRSLWELFTQTGSAYLYVNGVMTPVTQNSTSLIYHAGTATPTRLSWSAGRYGDGKLFSLFRSTTIRVGPRGSLSLEADNTRQYLDNGTVNQQWLERASFAYQKDRDTSFAVGVRRFFGPPPVPYGGSSCVVAVCTNLSFAYHKKMPHAELYVIYGDASRAITTPQFLIKLIQYVGADKGT